MADTAGTLVDLVRGKLLSGISEQRNRLAMDYTAGSEELNLEFPTTGIGPGTRLSIGQSVFHTWSVNQSSGVVSVAAGEDGSPDGNLTTGSMVRVNPRFTDWAIFREINTELSDLSASGLYQMQTFEFIYTTDKDAFEIPVTDLQEPYAVAYQDPSTRKSWPYLPRPYWRLERESNTTDFPSGLALHFLDGYDVLGPHSAYKVRLLYRAPFTVFATTADLVSSTGLPSTATDIVQLGATLRLVAPREIKRNFTESQPNPRRGEEVPSGGAQRSWAGTASLRQARIVAEAARLAKQFPTRRW